MGEPRLAAHPCRIDQQQLPGTFARQFAVGYRTEYAAKALAAADVLRVHRPDDPSRWNRNCCRWMKCING
jgi:hypothetical protein